MQPTGMAFTSISPILFSTLLILYFALNLKGYISQTMKLGALGIPSYRSFSVEELEAATNNFELSSFMGEGSHGQVCHYRYFNSSMFTLEVLQIVACQYALWLFLLGNSFCALFMCFSETIKMQTSAWEIYAVVSFEQCVWWVPQLILQTWDRIEAMLSNKVMLHNVQDTFIWSGSVF